MIKLYLKFFSIFQLFSWIKVKVLISFAWLDFTCMSSILDFRALYVCAAYLPANNLRRISTIYVRGYWKGSENGRVFTIVKYRVPIIHDGKYSPISCSYDAWWEIRSNFVFLWCMLGNTVILCSYDAWWEIQSTFVFLWCMMRNTVKSRYLLLR